jgi:hypothetical protein
MSSNLGLLVYKGNAVYTTPGLAAPFLDLKETDGATGYRFFVSTSEVLVRGPFVLKKIQIICN